VTPKAHKKMNLDHARRMLAHLEKQQTILPGKPRRGENPMAAVPVIINGVLYPKEKGGQVIPAVFCGYLSIEGLSVGGGPIIDEGAPVPPDPPIDVPPDGPPSGPSVAVVVKPAPVTGGWGVATDASGAFKWFFMPAQGGAGPKR
jgi:hypothetical protein